VADLPLPESRRTALSWIAASSVTGYLGLFVGTGFSKAATSDRAPGFEELLKKVADRLQLPSDFDDNPVYRRKSLPQIASQLLNDYAAKHPSADRAVERFREEIAQLCNLAPEVSLAGRLKAALESTRPAWIITTNYDLVLESLIEDAESILPTAPLVARASRLPIYHLHGHRHNPGTIKITEEDYVGLLGPIDYQRLKLPLLLLESSTVMLGYALGDINVRAAIEWSRSFRGEHGLRLAAWQGRVFHAVRKTAPRRNPYFGPDGQIVLEISDVAEFLEEIGSQRAKFEEWLNNLKIIIQEFLANPTNAVAVANDPAIRGEFLKIIENSLSHCQPARMIDFLSRVLDPIWAKAREDMGFEYYDTYLKLLLDILERIKLRSANPGLLFYLGDALDKVGWYLDNRKLPGSAHAATDTWLVGHVRIPDEVKRELKSYADAYDRNGLSRALEYAGVVATNNTW
jgi:hypothetical protein